MASQKVDSQKIDSLDNQQLTSRLESVIANLPPSSPPTPLEATTLKIKKLTKTVVAEEKRMMETGDIVEQTRTRINLPILAEATVTVQSLGRDIYVIDGEIEVLKGNEFDEHIARILQTQLGITQSPLKDPPKEIESACQRLRCSRRLHQSANSALGGVWSQRCRTEEDKICIRTRCSQALPDRRTGR